MLTSFGSTADPPRFLHDGHDAHGVVHVRGAHVGDGERIARHEADDRLAVLDVLDRAECEVVRFEHRVFEESVCARVRRAADEPRASTWPAECGEVRGAARVELRELGQGDGGHRVVAMHEDRDSVVADHRLFEHETEPACFFELGGLDGARRGAEVRASVEEADECRR
jgi:hypothetical protein